MSELIQLDPNFMVGGKWRIEKKLGEGAFGAVYKCGDGEDNLYALKVEGKEEKVQLLKMEVHVLTELANAGGRHFCKIYGKGTMLNFNYVVMTFVGISLDNLKAMAPKKKFSFGTAVSIGCQCLEALEDLHGIGYLHRDVKPANFTIGRAAVNELRKVYVLDFGMARKFVANDGKTLRKPRDNAGFRGTVKYAPLACHQNRDQGRFDDCESWLYMIAELTRGNLPWRNLQDMKEVGAMKARARTDPFVLKQVFGGCPTEYIEVFRIIEKGGFFDEPDYQLIYTTMKKTLRKLNVPEFPYDWEGFLMKKWQDDKAKEDAAKAAAKGGAAKPAATPAPARTPAPTPAPAPAAAATPAPAPAAAPAPAPAPAPPPKTPDNGSKKEKKTDAANAKKPAATPPPATPKGGSERENKPATPDEKQSKLTVVSNVPSAPPSLKEKKEKGEKAEKKDDGAASDGEKEAE